MYNIIQRCIHIEQKPLKYYKDMYYVLVFLAFFAS